MTTDTNPPIDWRHWLERWDAQQAAYLPGWEERFTAMLDVLEALLPEQFVAVDLAGGPGTISRRLLARFPRARCIVVDLDPLLLALGEGALGTMDGRLRWVEADLKSAAWMETLGVGQVDAVLSTTALHWLPAEYLVRVYRDLGRLVRPSGVVLNGDNMNFSPDLPTFQKLADWMKERLWSDEALAARGAENWRQWWEAIAREPAAAELLAERERRFGAAPWVPNTQRPGATAWVAGAPRTDGASPAERPSPMAEATTAAWTPPIYDMHVAALRDAGFREVGVIWQNKVNNRVLLAVR